ncbi:PilN domain-containing protein [Rubrivirga sp.]|uniref:PilN domain-containing protein n=1 Tax=Rubrivirga sp. TaxID=1885344 RepID=UPI003C7813E1
MSDSFIFPESPDGAPGSEPDSDFFGDAGASFDDPGASFDDPGASFDDPGLVFGDPASLESREAGDVNATFDAPALPAGDGEASADDGLEVSFAEADDDVAAETAQVVAGTDAVKVKKAPRRRSKDALMLGIHITPSRVYGVLVQSTSEGYEPLRQFVRNRSEGQFGTGAMSPDVLDDDGGFEVGQGDDIDPSIQFGAVGEIDFGAEFAGMGIATDAVQDSSYGGEVAGRAQPIVFELRDILEECTQAGYENPSIAFLIDEPDVAYADILVPPKADKKSKGKTSKKDDEAQKADLSPVKRDRLLELLPETPDFVGDVRERIAFVEMTPRDGLRRYLAVAPTQSEPVTESIELLREQSAYRKVAFRTLEAEVPLLVGLVGATSAPEPHENTAVVRVGGEDTLVLLLSGDKIQHFELMQSVTAFDGPDTICSRVLLQQDVQGVGTVHNVVVVAEEREKELVQGFAAFYPDARVETLREGLARLGLVGPYGPLAPMLVGAAGVAVAGHQLKQKGSPFASANLLPTSLRKRKRAFALAFGWHTLVVAAALFLTVLYFSYRYVSQEGEIAAAEQRLAEFPPAAQMSGPQLQARIDSLQGRQVALASALVALDSVLIDTDRWTQTLLRTTRAAAQTGGIWIEEWTPVGDDIQLVGYSTTRANVVGLAQRLSASIQEVTFESLREYPVYQYRVQFTQPRELPQVTRVLREQAALEVADDLAPDDDGLDAAPPTDDL